MSILLCWMKRFNGENPGIFPLPGLTRLCSTHWRNVSILLPESITALLVSVVDMESSHNGVSSDAPGSHRLRALPAIRRECGSHRIQWFHHQVRDNIHHYTRIYSEDREHWDSPTPLRLTSPPKDLWDSSSGACLISISLYHLYVSTWRYMYMYLSKFPSKVSIANSKPKVDSSRASLWRLASSNRGAVCSCTCVCHCAHNSGEWLGCVSGWDCG